MFVIGGKGEGGVAAGALLHCPTIHDSGAELFTNQEFWRTSPPSPWGSNVQWRIGARDWKLLA